jgi:nitroimidazol reductase NimA-like FMN-containing flavoprotein (pyridoxamine 5'-phosphate oxidase superfamily)
MSETIKDAVDYIGQSRYALLITVDPKISPSLRYIGPFINDGPDIIFMTSKDSKKVKHIALNPFITLYFQDANQTEENFKSASVTGRAFEIPGGEEFENAVKSLIKRSPKIEEWIRGDGFKSYTFYKLRAESVQFTDFSKWPSTAEERV